MDNGILLNTVRENLEKELKNTGWKFELTLDEQKMGRVNVKLIRKHVIASGLHMVVDCVFSALSNIQQTVFIEPIITFDIEFLNKECNTVNITKKDMLDEYNEFINRGATPSNITLKIQMPTGEIETIINPNVANKIAYIDKAYNDELHLKTCDDISIVSWKIE